MNPLQLTDTTRVIVTYLDNSSLEKLYLSGVIPCLSNLVIDQHFWHARVETFSRIRIDYSEDVNWKETYSILSEVSLEQSRVLFYNSADNSTVLEILHSLQFRPDLEAFVLAVRNNSINIFSYLLQEDSLTSESNLSEALVLAAGEGHENIVELLLADKRVDPSREARDTTALLQACATPSGNENGNYTRIVRMLLSDHRTSANRMSSAALCSCSDLADDWEIVQLLLECKNIDPSFRDNDAIIYAATMGRDKTVALLLADPRVNPSDLDNEAIVGAATEGYTRVVKLLLSDNRVNPRAQNYKALSGAVEWGHIKIVKLLLADERVNLEKQELERLIELAKLNDRHEIVGLLLRIL